MVGLMEQNEAKASTGSYEFTVAGAPQDIQAKLINGELDIAAVPANLAAALYNKTEGEIKTIAVSTLSVLYLLDRTGEINSMADLAGKTIYASAPGAMTEYVLRYLIEANGLTEKVTVEFKGEHTELAALLAAGEADIAMLPQPFVTTVTAKSPEVRVALDFNDEWEKVTNAKLAMTCIVARAGFLGENKAAVDTFLKEYEASTAYVNANVDEAAALSGKFDIIAEDIAKIAIPECGIVFFAGEELEASIAPVLEVLMAANPQSVGGKLPDEAFYYKG
jgi:NitT/TauT family transport system substrate-binding protein